VYDYIFDSLCHPLNYYVNAYIKGCNFILGVDIIIALTFIICDPGKIVTVAENIDVLFIVLVVIVK